MIKKTMSIAFIAIVFVFASGWTFIDVPSPKEVILEDEFDYSRTETFTDFDDCAGEYIDYVLNIRDWGTVVQYDDGSQHLNFHFNYYNSTGIGQTTGNTYRFIGAGHFNINSIAGSAVVITQQANMTGQGMGVVSKLKSDLNVVTNANGDVVVLRIGDFTTECR